MNSLCFYAVISCLFAVATTEHSNPPMNKKRPINWGPKRESRLTNKNDWFIQIEKDGTVSGSRFGTEAAVIVTISGGNQTVALKGKLANKFLCMNNQSKIYSRDTPDETDCYFVEGYHANDYNTYHHYYHRRGDKKNYLSIANDGTVKVGDVNDKKKIYFLPLPLPVVVSTTSKKAAATTAASTTITTTISPVSTSTVAPIKRKLENTRKRRRRWCKLLLKGKLERNPNKYAQRCKHDCNILNTMLDNPKRYKRKCEKQRTRRRRRNRKKYIRVHGPNHRRRHHHGGEEKQTRNSRDRGRERKRTPVRSAASSQTHNIDVT